MRFYSAIVGILCIMAFSIEMGVAQQHTMLSRAALDSLVNPALSAQNHGAVVAENMEIDLGEINGNERYSATYRLRNTTEHPIAITTLRSSCSCLRVESSPQSIPAGETIDINVTFTPAGRSGEFDLATLVYTTLDDSYPTLRLRLVGDIAAEESFAHLPYNMGGLRLSRREVTFEGTKPGTTRHEYIVVGNATTKQLRISSRATVEGLSLSTSPEVLEPGEEGEIRISYSPTHPYNDTRTVLIVEGITASATERMIDVTIRK